MLAGQTVPTLPTGRAGTVGLVGAASASPGLVGALVAAPQPRGDLVLVPGLTAARWQQRHQDYQARGITDVWLWILQPTASGNRTHSDQSSDRRVNPGGEPDRVRAMTARMSVAQQAAVQAGQPALWVLLDGRIATGYTGRPYQEELDLDRLWLDKYWWLPERLARTGLRTPNPDRLDQAGGGKVTVAVDLLAACTLTPQGIDTPMLARIQTERDTLHRLAAPAQQRAQEALKTLAAARERLQARLPPRWHAEFATPDLPALGVRAPAADMRAWVYETLRGHLATAASVPVDDLIAQCRTLGVVEPRNRGVELVITRFLARLRDLRIITVQARPGSIPGRPQQHITRGPRYDRWEPRVGRSTS